jgi:hypothetical protein
MIFLSEHAWTELTQGSNGLANEVRHLFWWYVLTPHLAHFSVLELCDNEVDSQSDSERSKLSVAIKWHALSNDML